MELSGLLLLVAFILSCLAIGVMSMATFDRMVEEVNPQLAHDQQFDPVGWHRPKYRRLIQEYRRLNPQGHLIRRAVWLSGALVAVVLAAGWLMGFSLASVLFVGLAGSSSLWLVFRK